MSSRLLVRFWLPLLLSAGSIALTPLFRAHQPPLQSVALAVLLSGTIALAGYLCVVIARPERF
ncbi:MAG: hypothetical protein VKI83_00835 [Synechococcaceae cyanobacterium]|nr:hypothetical protein [Synechococcaceae cyanobacterium]